MRPQFDDFLAAVLGVYTAQVMKDLKAVENWTDLGTTIKANGFGAKVEDWLQCIPTTNMRTGSHNFTSLWSTVFLLVSSSFTFAVTTGAVGP